MKGNKFGRRRVIRKAAFASAFTAGAVQSSRSAQAAGFEHEVLVQPDGAEGTFIFEIPSEYDVERKKWDYTDWVDVDGGKREVAMNVQPFFLAEGKDILCF